MLKFGTDFQTYGALDGNLKTFQILKTVDSTGTETHFKIKQNILQNSRLQIHLGENEVSD